MKPKRFDVYMVELDPRYGESNKRKRACAILSPNEMNRHLNTVIIAPMTTSTRDYPTRIEVHMNGVDGQIALDQLRVIDTRRLQDKLGTLPGNVQKRALSLLSDLFAK